MTKQEVLTAIDETCGFVYLQGCMQHAQFWSRTTIAWSKHSIHIWILSKHIEQVAPCTAKFALWPIAECCLLGNLMALLQSHCVPMLKYYDNGCNHFPLVLLQPPQGHWQVIRTTSSAVTDRPHDASCHSIFTLSYSRSLRVIQNDIVTPLSRACIRPYKYSIETVSVSCIISDV